MWRTTIQKLASKYGHSGKRNNRGVGLTKLQHIIQDNKGQLILNEKSDENGDMIQVTIMIPI